MVTTSKLLVLFGEFISSNSSSFQILGTSNGCWSIDSRATNQWCTDNCNHIPSNCPSNICKCRHSRLADEVPSSPLASVSGLLGVFEKPLHGVAGEVFSLADPTKLLVKEFSYDGQGPDIFFYVGTSGSPSSEGILLPHPHTGKDDSSAPVLRRYDQEDVVLKLPHGITTDKLAWISVWCREYAVDFGHVIFNNNSRMRRSRRSWDNRGTLNRCFSIDSRATNEWCTDNCNHIPSNCPSDFCICIARHSGREDLGCMKRDTTICQGARYQLGTWEHAPSPAYCQTKCQSDFQCQYWNWKPANSFGEKNCALKSTWCPGTTSYERGFFSGSKSCVPPTQGRLWEK